VLKYGTGGINIGECRIDLDGDYKSDSNGRPSLTGLSDGYDPTDANIRPILVAGQQILFMMEAKK